MASRRLTKSLGAGCLTLLVVGAGVFFLTPFGKAFRDLWGVGAVQALAPVPQRQYAASRDANLKAISTAMGLYQDSEGQYPEANGWMDGISHYLEANDLKAPEARKKLIRPDLEGQSDAYGYAMNDAASAKYKGDLKPGTVLVYETEQTGRNAHGSPESDASKASPPARGVTIEGTVVDVSPSARSSRP